MAAGNRRETGFHVLTGMIAAEKRYLLSEGHKNQRKSSY
jgi:hypothetical protein